MVPLAILRCKAEERLYLAAKANPEGLGDEWTIARDKSKWKSRQLVLVVTTAQGADEIGYVGLADRGKWTGTHQGDLVVTGLSRLAGPIGFRDMTAAVPTFAKKYLEDEGVVTPRARDVILTAAFALRPGLSEVVDKLLKQQPPISVPGPVGRLAAQFRDACGLEIGYMLHSRAGSKAEADFLRDVADGLYELVQVTAADGAALGVLGGSREVAGAVPLRSGR